jgi:hypothetical protein
MGMARSMGEGLQTEPRAEPQGDGRRSPDRALPKSATLGQYNVALRQGHWYNGRFVRAY